MSKKTEYRSVYKCRLCKGTLVEGATKHCDTAIRLIENACCNHMESLIDPTLLTYHFCEDGSVGICDFQGFYLVETEEMLENDADKSFEELLRPEVEGMINTDE